MRYRIVRLAVMGENLALNMESKGFTVAVYNRSVPAKRELSTVLSMAGAKANILSERIRSNNWSIQ